MRLDKFIVAVGAGSRSQAKTMVKAKRLTVNGQVAKKSDLAVNEQEDQICLDGEVLVYSEFDYLMLNKPAGVISATEDPQERTVLDLLPARYHRVAPVGRLDKDTVGLLLLTNDGHLNHNLLSPKKHVDKCYEVTLAAPCQPDYKEKMQAGVVLEDGYVCLPARIDWQDDIPHIAYLTIQEGKFHQVKRMFAALGNQVTHLKRIRMGSLVLDEHLAAGEFRQLTEEEVRQLKGKR
ncbi:pseudouridine synthase [Streptococcus ovuberis]|uniref:pseudouridine synthase n=1 Tax=Streptococcus ovuberis TaxID=1936207 RepID=UPI001B35051F|nr:pseudouridine synthase [Streptococcus ovuberis]